MAENILHYCKRNKNYTISPGMEKVLKKAFIDYNAVKLPEGSFEILYAEKGNLLSEMRSSANQIIWGRRGTGKTHLLNAFVESINNNYETADIAIYISCDRMSKETPREAVTLKNDYDKVRYFANDTFKNFMKTLCEKLFDQYEDVLSYKKAAINTERQFDEYLERIGRKIIVLSEICTKGVPYSVHVVRKTSSSNVNSTQRKKGLSAEAGVDKCSFLGFLKGIFSKTKSTDTEDVEKIEEETQYEHYLPSVYNAVADLLEEMRINLYVCIDELWLIDEKSPISFQPFFLDNIRQSLGSHAQLGIKIASIRETTNLNNKTDVRVSYGMQSGNDIIELAYLDPIQSKMHEVYNMFKEMMVKRINYHTSRELRAGNFGEPSIHQNEYDANYIIQMLFKDERNFNNLVNMSHGIPRNFINILNTCIRRLDYNFSANFIHCYLISDVVIDTYKNEHRSGISFVEENTVYKAIDEYARSKKQYFFLIDNKTANRLRPEINTLLYNEIIHRIPSAETPANIMNSYKAYYLDLGMYFMTIRDTNFEEYVKIVNDFQLLLPADLGSNFNNYILDLNKIESSLVICPSCKAIFPKTQPVFSQYHICPECAAEISQGG